MLSNGKLKSTMETEPDLRGFAEKTNAVLVLGTNRSLRAKIKYTVLRVMGFPVITGRAVDNNNLGNDTEI